MRTDARFLRHTSASLYTDALTGAQVAVENFFYSDGDGAWVVIKRDDGTLIDYDMTLAEFGSWRAFLFPSTPTGIRTTPPTGRLIPLPDLSEVQRIMREKQQERRQRTESLAAD